MTHSKFLTTAIKAAKEAEKITLHYYQENISIDTKEDDSPVTVADREAEQTIRRIISSEFPDHKFLGEEFGGADSLNDSDYVWIIDPIDGTKNYVRQIPFFGTQIGLMKGNTFIVGVSNMPAIHELMYAEKGIGSFLNNQKVHVSSVAQIEDAYIGTGSLKWFAELNKLTQYSSLAANANHLRMFGDCWTSHLVAQGKMDCAMEGYVNIWDIAALTVIVQEAGGKVTDLYGKPVDKDSKTYLATNSILHSEVIKRMKQ